MVEHPTTKVKIDDQVLDIDVDVAKLVLALNDSGFETTQSCQEVDGEKWAAGQAYVELGPLKQKERERLLSAIERTFQRLNSTNYPAFSTCDMDVRDEVTGVYAVRPHYVDRQTVLTCSCYNRKGDLEAARARRREALAELAAVLREV